jgi:hypothetical protein
MNECTLQFKEIEMRSTKKPKNFKIKKSYNRNTAHVEYNNNSDTSNNRGYWNHPESAIRQQGTKQNSHTGHCTHTAGSTDVQYKVCIVGNNITCAVYCNNRIAATLCSVGTCFDSGI